MLAAVIHNFEFNIASFVKINLGFDSVEFKTTSFEDLIFAITGSTNNTNSVFGNNKDAAFQTTFKNL